MVWGGNDNAVDTWIKQLEANDPSLLSLHILSIRRIPSQDLARLFNAIANNNVLKDLYCSGRALDLSSAQALAQSLKKNTTLGSLNVGNADLGQQPEILSVIGQGLAENEGLVHLDLENKGLDHASMLLVAPCLEKNTTLRQINLSRNRLDDQAVGALTMLFRGSSLQSLNLALNQISAAGGEKLAESLNGSAIKELDMSDNPLLHGAARVAEAVICNPHARQLKLNRVMGIPDDVASMDSSLQEPSALLMHAIATSLSKDCGVECMELDGNHIQSSSLSEMTKVLPHSQIQRLALRNNFITDEAAIALAEGVRTLKHLDLSDNRVTSVGFGALLDTSLEHLDLCNNMVCGFGEAPNSLPDLLDSNIRALSIGCNSISLNDMRAIVEILTQNGVPHLVTLDMGGNYEEADVEAWETEAKRLQQARPKIDLTWRRAAGQMDTQPPPLMPSV